METGKAFPNKLHSWQEKNEIIMEWTDFENCTYRKKERNIFRGWECVEFPRNSKCHKKLGVFWKLQKRRERKLLGGGEFREKRDWFSTSDFPLEPPFVTVADV